jgi:uncharacterized protein DUF6883
MRLPSGEQAIIDRRKIADYCLSTEHEDGQHKAHVFASVLGLSAADVDELVAALRNATLNHDATLAKLDEYGQRYVIDFPITGRSATALIRSALIVRTNETVPRLMTCYIL